MTIENLDYVRKSRKNFWDFVILLSMLAFVLFGVAYTGWTAGTKFSARRKAMPVAESRSILPSVMPVTRELYFCVDAQMNVIECRTTIAPGLRVMEDVGLCFADGLWFKARGGVCYMADRDALGREPEHLKGGEVQ